MTDFIFINDSKVLTTANGDPSTNSVVTSNVVQIIIDTDEANASVNSTAVTFTNSSINFSFFAPTSSQMSLGNYFLASNSKWVPASLISSASGGAVIDLGSIIDSPINSPPVDFGSL